MTSHCPNELKLENVSAVELTVILQTASLATIGPPGDNCSFQRVSVFNEHKRCKNAQDQNLKKNLIYLNY